MLHKISITLLLLVLAFAVAAEEKDQAAAADDSAKADATQPATDDGAANGGNAGDADANAQKDTAPAAAGDAAKGDAVQINPGNPGKYTVVKGDTLWGIAGKFLTQPWRWTEIWKANPQVSDPNLIYPGDVITLSYEGGSPVLTASREGAAGDRTVKLSPAVRSERRREAIPTIPIDVIKQFLTRPLVVAEGEMESWPYVVSSYDQHLVAGPGNRIYVKGMDSAARGRTYSIYRKGPAYHKGAVQSSGVLGYEAIYVGEAVIEETGDPATAMVTQASREVLNGDRLVARSEKEITSDFMPRPPAGDVHGNIISVIDGVSEIGQYQVVVLDVGSTQGIEVGNVLGVYQSGKVVMDTVPQKESMTHPFIDYLGSGPGKGDSVTLPPSSAGVVMVFRTFPQVSYALVMKATGALKLQDTVRSL